MFKYFTVTMAAIALVLSSVMITRAVIDPNLSGLSPEAIRQIVGEISTKTGLSSPGQPGAVRSYLGDSPDGPTQVIEDNVRVNGLLQATTKLCLGEDTGNCKTNWRGEWCGFSGAVSGQMDCHGVSLPNCPDGYSYMSIGLASSFGMFGTCIHR